VPYRHRLIVNGLDAALSRQFGCACKRCLAPRPVAHTSVSIISLDELGQTQHHVLVDVGLGVPERLVNSSYLAGEQAQLDWLLLTHWHPDHTLGLNWLASTWWRATRHRFGQSQPLPVWCRTGTAGWLARRHEFEWQRLITPHLSAEIAPPGTLLKPIPLAVTGLRITPVTVSHLNGDVNPANPKKPLPCCAAFVVETPAQKAVLLWDLDNENDWIEAPASPAQKAAVERLAHADYLFIDCATWAAETAQGQKLNHLSFSRVQRYAAALSPKETLLVHLSGHPDGPGQPGYGWTDAQWTAKASQVWHERGLSGLVRVPAIGESFDL